ncbi:hypothetical protein QUF76_03945 [Desulfobacterales bacterium HSG16]|nr:hypothetical protein [Desulfobacterales bacterium HSG16]
MINSLNLFRPVFFIFFFVLILHTAGCQNSIKRADTARDTTYTSEASSQDAAAKDTSSLDTSAQVISNESQKKLSEEYFRQGKDAEETGDYENALIYYKQAREQDYQYMNAQIEGSIDRIENFLPEHLFSQGKERYKFGFHYEGKDIFQKVLQISPNHHKASQLYNKIKEPPLVGVINHVIRNNDDLRKITQAYYGNYRDYYIVNCVGDYNRRINQNFDPNRLIVGSRVKLPPVNMRNGSIKHPNYGKYRPAPAPAPAPVPVPVPVPAPVPAPAPVKPDPVAVSPAVKIKKLLTEGRKLFNSGRYKNSIKKAEKIIDIDPGNQQAVNLAFDSYYKMAEIFENKGNMTSAIRNYKKALDRKKDCADCIQRIKKCGEINSTRHYKAGKRYYDNEKLKEAVREWKKVRVVNPNYKSELLKGDTVRDDIRKTEELIRLIEGN